MNGSCASIWNYITGLECYVVIPYGRCVIDVGAVVVEINALLVHLLCTL